MNKIINNLTNIGKSFYGLIIYFAVNMIFSYIIKSNNDNLIEDKESTKYGKFILIDMAGNEKVAEIKPNTDNFYINKSLFSLTNCINGLIHNKNSNYIPWRN